MRRCALLLLTACAPDPTLTPEGDWEATLTCTDGPLISELPACDRADALLLRLTGSTQVEGEHLSFFPGFERPGGAYSGMVGASYGGFVDGELRLTLVGDLDYAFASEGDLDGWSDHHLVLEGVFESVCWNARFSWVHQSGEVDVSGTAVVRRAEGACR